MKPKLIAIVGPNASGKTALGVRLAKALGGEILSADSRQVYRGLDIGTGKATKKEMRGVPHHLLSIASPARQFTVDDFVKKARRAYSLIRANGRIPIVVGGTGLYVDMLLGRMSYPAVPPDPALRARLERKSAAQLLAQLKMLDPARAAAIEPHNKRRLVRAIEVAKGRSRTSLKDGTAWPSGLERRFEGSPAEADILWLGLNPGDKKLRENIRARLRARLRAGMIKEAHGLHERGLSYRRMEELGLEYRYLARLLQKKITREEFEVGLERAIARYAKRQVRWFKRNPDIVWVRNYAHALKLAKKFLA